MFNIKKLLKIIVFVLIFLTITMGPVAVSNAEQTLKITNWIIESNILENGDLKIREDITFNLKGTYNGVFREVVLKGTSGISDIRIIENSKDKVLEYKRVEDAKKGDNNLLGHEKN